MMQDRVYQTPVRDVTNLRQRVIDTWYSLLQSIVIDATDEWRKRLQACAIVIELELGLVMQINWMLF